MASATIEISIERFESLEDSELQLINLEENGVDNWIGYDDAMESYREDLVARK